jgi:NAD-dependent SIR2 family protein deacetylase
MSKLVFILGAGCSAAAGVPTMPRFLDAAESISRGKQLSDIDQAKFDLVFRAYDCLQSIYSKSSEIDLLNVESLFAALEMAETIGTLRGLAESHSVSELIPAIKRTIVRTIELTANFPNRGAPVPYGQFCTWLKSRPAETSILTFNYDLCLDWALNLSGLQPDYRLPNDGPEDRGSVDVLKLHGSLNWAFCEQCGIVPKRLHALTQAELGRVIRPAAGSDVRLAITDAIAYQTCSRCSKSFSGEPVIVPPTWNKGSFSSGSMKTVWARAAKHLAEAEYIVIIGYSVPPTDQFFHYLYALGTMSQIRVKKILVYNPDESIEDRYRRLLGPTVISRFKFISGRDAITGAEHGKFGNAIQCFGRDLGNW